MTRADRLTVFKQTAAPSWPLMLEFFNEVAGELYEASLEATGDTALDALRVAQGAKRFLKLLNQRVAGLQSEVSDEKPQIEKPTDPNAPLEIL